jgi:hypothetical protein
MAGLKTRDETFESLLAVTEEDLGDTRLLHLEAFLDTV